MALEYFHEGFDTCFDHLTGMSIGVGDPLLDWVNDPRVLRMFNVGQLGLARDRPTHNYWTRGEHVMSGAIMAREIARQNGFSELDQTRAGILMVYHDPHPAGGDGVKNLLDIDEASVAETYWFEGTQGERFIARCHGLGLDPIVEQAEILAMISREADSPLAKLVHNLNRSIADADFVSYTLADLAFGTQGTARMHHDEKEWRRCRSKSSFPSKCEVSLDLAATGAQLGTIVNGGEFGTSSAIRSQTFSLADFNPIGRMEWVEDVGEWVFTDSEVLAHTIVASAVLHTFLYFHPGMQGPELRLGQEVSRSGLTDHLRDVVMTLDDDGLHEFLDDHNLGYWVSPEAHDGWIYNFRGTSEGKPGTYKTKLPKFNLRLDTPVMDSGR